MDSILESRLKAWLHEQGVEAEFHISRLTTSGLTIDDLAYPADGSVLKAKQVSVDYDLATIKQKGVGHILIDGLTVNLQSEEQQDELEDLKQLAPESADKKSEGIALPFDELEIKDAKLIARQPKGEPLTLGISLTLRRDYTGSAQIHEVDLPLETGGSLLLTNLHATRETPDAPIALSLESIAHITADKPYFTPMKADGSITLARDNQDVTGIITIHDTRDKWTLALHGSAARDKGTWNITGEQPQMNFETGVIQPDMLFPVLRGAVSQVSGGAALAFHAEKAAEDAEITSGGTLTLANLGGTIRDVPVTGINGKVQFSSLWPPATKGQQQVKIGEIVLGLPLQNGTMPFTLKKDGTVVFAPSTWKWVDGELRTAGASMNIHNPQLPDVTLSATGLHLEELLGSLLQKGISATGRLDGRIPVHFTKDGNAMINKGTLATKGGGVIRYAPTEDSPLQMGNSFQTDLLLSAMQNFHYDELSMAIDSKDEHALNVLLHLKGRNPEVYSGQTIELNINLNGNLLDIVQSGLNAYTLPERLEEQLTQ